ncbi:MAG: molybdopterin-dependent oxidoreductase [Candidatus Heimdallarchaeota archaeon]
MAKKTGTLITVIALSAVILAGTGVSIWLGVRYANNKHPALDWSLKASGNLVGDDFNITMAELLNMPSYEQEYTISGWPDDTIATFKGVQLSYLLENVINYDPSAVNITFSAWDGYSWTFDIAQFINNDTYILAYEQDGQFLTSYPEGGIGYLYLVMGAKNPSDFNGQYCVKSVVELIFT